jgi:AraC family transcriptional regulator
MRSEYSWLPPDGSVTTTLPYQIGVSFSEHRRVGYERDGAARYLTVPAGAVFVTGPQEVRWSEVAEPTEALEMYPDPELLRTIADPGGIRPAVAVPDTTTLGVAAVLKRTHVNGHDLDAMQASALVHRLATHLADQYGPPRSRPIRRPGRLDRDLLDRVRDYVEDRLGDSLVLDDLAAEARLSTYHFARSFKSSTGMAPHEFVTMRRMERAKTMLLATRRSVPDVAYAVGYSNLSHFRRQLRRFTGFTPSDLRPGRTREDSKNRPSADVGRVPPSAV